VPAARSTLSPQVARRFFGVPRSVPKQGVFCRFGRAGDILGVAQATSGKVARRTRRDVTIESCIDDLVNR